MRQVAGFTCLALLLAIAIMGVTLALAAQVFSFAERRAREEQLLFVGDQFRRALGEYHRQSAGRPRRLPRELNELLRDSSHATVKRYLRRVYFDPLTGRPEWGLIRDAQGGILGIHSMARGAPIKRAGFAPEYGGFEGARGYADWKFMIDPAAPAGATAAPAAAGSTTAAPAPTEPPFSYRAPPDLRAD